MTQLHTTENGQYSPRPSYLALPRRVLSQTVCTLLAVIFMSTAPLTGANSFDTDGDLIDDIVDNCTLVSNVDQRDTDQDGIGNPCDPDLNQDCSVNFVDVAQFSGLFLSADEDADFNGDGTVNFLDYLVLTNAFLLPPGPSGIPNICEPATPLELTGITSPVPLGGAAISAVVDQTASGGGVTVQNTIANGDGSFVILLDAPNPSDFITLAAVGLGAQTGISLSSLAGNVQQLSARGGSDGTVDFTEADELRLTPLSTAFAVLASEANGADVNSQAILESSETRVDASELLALSAELDAIIQDPSVALPAGVTDTLTLASNNSLREDFRVRLRTDQLTEFDNAVARVIAYEDTGFDEADVSGVVWTNYLNNILTLGGSQFEFGASNTVTFRSEVTADGVWSLDTEGRLLITLDAPILTSTFIDFIEDPNNPGEFIQTERRTFLESIELTRVREGRIADTVTLTRNSFSNFTDFPELGDTPLTQTPGLSTARLLFGEQTILPFSPFELVGNGLVASFGHTLNAAEGTGTDPRFGMDTLDFVFDGTGVTRRRNLSFTWQVLDSGELNVMFANGETSVFRRLINGMDGTAIGHVTYQVGGEPEVLRRTFMFLRDETVGFDALNIVNKTYRSSVANSQTFGLPELAVFDFAVSAGGVACRNPDSPSSTWDWTVVDGRLEFLRDFGPQTTLQFARTWQPVRVVDNRYWVIETLQTDDDSVPVVDASMTPGRLNIYTLRHDNTGNSRPTLVPDTYVTAQDTPITLYLRDLVENDSDPEGDQIIVRSLNSLGASGTVSVANPSNVYPYAYIYQPPVGFTGTDTFEFAASDLACRGDDAVPTTTVTITVQ